MLVVTLRRTGLSVADTRSYMQMVAEVAAPHGRCLRLLEHQRDAIQHQQKRMREDLAAVQAKIAHYRHLIDRELDCDGLSLDAATAALQRRSR